MCRSAKGTTLLPLHPARERLVVAAAVLDPRGGVLRDECRSGSYSVVVQGLPRGHRRWWERGYAESQGPRTSGGVADADARTSWEPGARLPVTAPIGSGTDQGLEATSWAGEQKGLSVGRFPGADGTQRLPSAIEEVVLLRLGHDTAQWRGRRVEEHYLLVHYVAMQQR